MRRGNERSVLLVDLDGTLTDPAKGIVGSFRFALEALGRIPPPASELTWIIGPPLRAVLRGNARRDLRSGGGAQHLPRALFDGGPVRSCRLRWRAQDLGGSSRGGGAIVSVHSKAAVYAERILRHFDLRRYFEGVYGAELDGRYEEKGDLIALILESQGLEAGDCCMWGDREHDVMAASRHAIPTIGALWGYGGASELTEAGAAVLCASPSEVHGAFAALPPGPSSLRARAS